MKELFMNSSIDFINNYYNYSEMDTQKLLYGLEGLYLTITKTIILLLLALLLNILKEVIVLIILFNIIRYTGFGFHAEKSYQCLIVSIINFVLLPYFMLKIIFSTKAILAISFISIISFLLYAPADTIKRPLPNRKKRIIRKISTILIGIIYTIFIFIINNNIVTSLLLSSLIIQSIVINPLIYKLFGQPFNNYKRLNQA